MRTKDNAEEMADRGRMVTVLIGAKQHTAKLYAEAARIGKSLENLSAVMPHGFPHLGRMKIECKVSIGDAVSLSRYTGRNHFLSDALVGGAIGCGIGRYVYHKRHDPNLDGQNEQSTQRDFIRSKLFPLITPRFGTSIANNGRAHDYGFTLAWKF